MSRSDEAIFEAVQLALPDTTCRMFSELCGMSEGYWGSIQAQDLELSTDALLHLAEMLEYKKEIGGRCVDIVGVRKAQELIANEVARRSERLSFTNERVRQMVLAAMARRSVVADQAFNLPPVILGWT